MNDSADSGLSISRFTRALQVQLASQASVKPHKVNLLRPYLRKAAGFAIIKRKEEAWGDRLSITNIPKKEMTKYSKNA